MKTKKDSRVYRVWFAIVLALFEFGLAINFYSGARYVEHWTHRPTAYQACIRYAATHDLASEVCEPLMPGWQPPPVTDCRLGPHDCGYADNGKNGDH